MSQCPAPNHWRFPNLPRCSSRFHHLPEKSREVFAAGSAGDLDQRMQVKKQKMTSNLQVCRATRDAAGIGELTVFTARAHDRIAVNPPPRVCGGVNRS